MTPPPLPSGETDPRIYFAAERTLLAWIRTGLALMGFGFVVARFGLFLRELAAAAQGAAPSASAMAVAQPHRVSLAIGTALVALGVLVNLMAAVQHARTVRRLRRGDTGPATKSAMGVVLATLLAALGAGMAVYLVVVGR